MATTSDWVEFETLVERIQRGLHPGASITRNAHLRGHDSGEDRQIDICIRYVLAGTEVLIVVDCKKWNRSISIPEMHSFAGIKKDVRAHVGIMVTEKGVSAGAQRIATSDGIELFTLLDTKNSNWDCRVRVPICFEDWLLISTFAQLIGADGKTSKMADKVVVNGKSVTLAKLIFDLWDREPNRKPGVASYSVEVTAAGKKFTADIWFKAEVERFVRTAWLSLVGLTKTGSEITYSDEAEVTMTNDPPLFHTHDTIVPPHETSIHAIPALSISVNKRRVLFDFRDTSVTTKLTLRGKDNQPLSYSLPKSKSSRSRT